MPNKPDIRQENFSLNPGKETKSREEGKIDESAGNQKKRSSMWSLHLR